MAFWIYAHDGSGIAGFDLLESETHTEVCQATEHNVEDGSPVTDHVRIESSQLSLSLGVTNTPISPTNDPGTKSRGNLLPLLVETEESRTRVVPGPPVGTPGFVFNALASAGEVPQGGPAITTLQFPFFDRIAEVEQTLLDIKNGARLCDVTGLSRAYSDLVLERIEVRREKPGLAMFEIDCRQIRFVKTAAVQAPKPLEPRGKPPASKGQQAPTQTAYDAAPDPPKSHAAAIYDKYSTEWNSW